MTNESQRRANGGALQTADGGVIEMSSDNAQSASSSWTDNISQPFPLSSTLLRCLFSIQHISTVLSAAPSNPRHRVYVLPVSLCTVSGPATCVPAHARYAAWYGPSPPDGTGTGTTRAATSQMHRVCSTVQRDIGDTLSNHSNINETGPETGIYFLTCIFWYKIR